MFASLATIDGVRLYSLQTGEARQQLTKLALDQPIADLGGLVQDFADTAAIMQQLDLVISCDSAPAHLAGALGMAVWTTLPFMPDWRWLRDRDDSPWYPSMRLYRQTRAGDWQGVFATIAKEMEKRASRGRPSRPGRYGDD